MSTITTGTFTVTSWNEEPLVELSDETQTIMRARATQQYSGVIAGEGIVEYLMVTPNDGSTSFVGLERITGSVSGYSGSFVIRQVGTYEGSTAKAEWSVVSGSGTGELRGLTGKGGYTAIHGKQTALSFEYNLED